MAGRASLPSSPPGGQSIQLPQLVLDLVWSLKQWPVVFTLQGVEYEIPAMCAADWVSVLTAKNMTPDDVFPGLLPVADAQEVERLLHAGDLEVPDVQEAALDAISLVSGRQWWVSLRLISVAQAHWDSLGGEMIKADASRLSLSAWLDFLFVTILRGMDKDKQTMFLMKLELAPEGWGPEADEMEMSQDAFLAMAG